MFADIGRALTLIAGRDVEVWRIAGTSLAVSASAVTVALLVGLPLTVTVLRAGDRLSRFAMWAAHAMAALPTVVVGLTLYFVLSSSGPLGWTKLLYTKTAMALGQLVLALPLLVAVVLGALQRLPVEAREVLITHGVAPGRQMRWLLWEVRFAVMSGACLAFARAFTELGSALIVGGNIRGATRTLTTYIALEYNRGDDARAIALGLILLAAALAANSLMHALTPER